MSVLPGTAPIVGTRAYRQRSVLIGAEQVKKDRQKALREQVSAVVVPITKYDADLAYTEVMDLAPKDSDARWALIDAGWITRPLAPLPKAEKTMAERVAQARQREARRVAKLAGLMPSKVKAAPKQFVKRYMQEVAASETPQFESLVARGAEADAEAAATFNEGAPEAKRRATTAAMNAARFDQPRMPGMRRPAAGVAGSDWSRSIWDE